MANEKLVELLEACTEDMLSYSLELEKYDYIDQLEIERCAHRRSQMYELIGAIRNGDILVIPKYKLSLTDL